ncbi:MULTISPECIES: hypothetical protein [Halomonas]|uniref:Uncharacterized protein n=2 Tax=Halomonas TaxID=2745 RepID=A0A2T0VC54_9GAMM|nr:MULTISPECIES: hypothetical protein [Halomonas]MDI5892505.1 hypothetical protein [Halomonas rhizosphaerae]MDI5922377.1 hypothetical protein [Halomonas rhizosphaerae]PRY67780.1 hypothetical protein BCL64_1196 [Halomonas ventosae]TDR51412.1 hypothetical protein DFP85_1174 [Halomonas ventosae]WFM71830.1 hypothetical protein P8934_02235 [Halomonas sp. CKK8]
MTVRTLAIALLILGAILPIVGWWASSPVAFVGPALLLLGVLLLWTGRRHHGR